MKKIGIWLDKRNALIVTLENNKENFKVVESNMDNYNVTANRHLGGSQEIVKDIKYLEREKHHFKAYFKEIIPHITDADALVLFGPAETYEKFAKELKENYKSISAKVKGTEKADSMTENQVKAWVRDFFKS